MHGPNYSYTEDRTLSPDKADAIQAALQTRQVGVAGQIKTCAILTADLPAIAGEAMGPVFC